MNITQNLQDAVNGYSIALANDSCNPAPNYAIDGMAVSRAEWRNNIMALIVQLNKTINQLNPYQITTTQRM